VGGTRQRILDTTGALLQRQGFHGTGLKQVAVGAGAPIGSVYHHFPGGKAELAAAALREMGAGYQLLVEGVVDSEPDLVAGVRAAFEAAADVLELSGYADACPIATVALEVASTDDALRRVTAEVFASWHASIVERALAAGVPPDGADRLAYLFVAALEGGFLLSRAARDTTPMRTLGESVVRAVQDELSRRRRNPSR
jgi:AcrR family transcriptional regulator